MDRIEGIQSKKVFALKLFLCLAFSFDCLAPPKKAPEVPPLKFSNFLHSMKNKKKPSPKKRSAKVISTRTEAPRPLRSLSCGRKPEKSALKKSDPSHVDLVTTLESTKFVLPSARAPHFSSDYHRRGLVPLPASTKEAFDPLAEDFSRLTPPFSEPEQTLHPKLGGPGGDQFFERTLPPPHLTTRQRTYWGVNPLQPADLSFVRSNFSNSFTAAKDDSHEEHLRSRGRGSGHNLRSPVAAALPSRERAQSVPEEFVLPASRVNHEDTPPVFSEEENRLQFLSRQASPLTDVLPQSREPERPFSRKKESLPPDLGSSENQISYLKSIFTSRGAKMAYAAASLAGLVLCVIGIQKQNPDPLDEDFEQESDANSKWWFKFGGGALLIMGITAFAVSTQVK